jgi:hypothetical protein
LMKERRVVVRFQIMIQSMVNGQFTLEQISLHVESLLSHAL